MKSACKQSNLPPILPQRVFLREDREAGALYEVTLKKVRYRSSELSSQHDADEEPISHLQWETVRVRKIKAGTLEKLVENLAPSKGQLEELDPGYLVAFLTTYRAFSCTEQVLDLLLKRYSFYNESHAENPQENHRVLRGIVGALLVWLEHFSSDFDQPPNFPILKKVLHFVKTEMNSQIKGELDKKVQHKLDMFSITTRENQGEPIAFRLSMARDVDYKVEPNKHDDVDMDLLSVNTTWFTEQLTIMDAALFRKVIAWHCMGSVWSRRKGKDGANAAPTVQATVSQFNAVSLKVIATILMCSGKKGSGPALRAKYITYWINIAQECRDLKNFSSLKAIISALQSAAIHRLKKTWQHVLRESMVLFNDLASLCSEDKNQQMSRDVLNKEGTAKWSDVDTPGHKRPTSLKKRRSRFMEMGIMQGTVPYLGTFLTDLMMLDTIQPDYTEDGLINFEKRRKEFEVIAQIKLFQEAAKNYTILTPDEKFRHWFDSIMTFSESESFYFSCELEKEPIKKKGSTRLKLRRMQSDPDISTLSLSPDSIVTRPASKSTEVSPVLSRHRRNNSNSSSSSTSSGISSGSETASAKSLPITKYCAVPPSSIETSAKSLTIPRNRASSPCIPSPATSSPQYSRPKTLNRFTLSLPLPGTSPRSLETGHIIRVSLEADSFTGVLYKGVWLTNEERTPSVIRTCMAKHDLTGDPSEYCLVQQLHDGNELVLPDYCNVYYAMKSMVEPLTFKLRKKSD